MLLPLNKIIQNSFEKLKKDFLKLMIDKIITLTSKDWFEDKVEEIPQREQKDRGGKIVRKEI